MFQPIYRYFKKIGNSVHISAWIFKGMCDESIKPSATSDSSLAPLLSYIGIRPRIKLNVQCFKQG